MSEHESAFSDASRLARKIGSRCMLDDGYFDTARCAAYIEPALIDRDTKLGTAEARIRELETQLQEMRPKTRTVERIELSPAGHEMHVTDEIVVCGKTNRNAGYASCVKPDGHEGRHEDRVGCWWR